MISTNGGVRSPEFWTRLAKFYQRTHSSNSHVVFCIDGLEDTNHIYRRNVVWSRLIENLSVFTKAGGNAHWRFIPFEHNQHQIEQAKILSTMYECTTFKLKISGRLSKHRDSIYTYTDENNKEITLKNPTIFNLAVKLKDDVDDRVHCRNEITGELYVDSHGLVYPCCWLATDSKYQQMFQNSLYMTSLQKILTNRFFTRQIYEIFSNDIRLCKERCGSLTHTISHIYLENGVYSVATPWNTEVVQHED